MANVLVNDLYLGDIADAIRSKLNVQTTYKPSEMANAIESISSGGGSSLGTKSITANGNYNASSDSLDGYSQVTVNVPNTYAAGDEGKVVSNGSLVAQTSDTVTTNATYDTTLINSLTVNVSGGGSTPPRLLDYREITLESTATSSNKLDVQLTPVDYYSIVVMIDTYPSAPDASEYIALIYQYSKYPAGGGAVKGDILRPAGTIGNDNTMCSFANTTGVLSIGGSYGHFMAGTKYHVYLFGMGVAS